MAAGGNVEKSGFGRPAPRNILVPLSLGIVDISEMALDQYRKANTTGSGWMGAWQRLIRGGADTVSGTVVNFGLSGVTFDIRKVVAFSGELSVGAIQLLSWPCGVPKVGHRL